MFLNSLSIEKMVTLLASRGSSYLYPLIKDPYSAETMTQNYLLKLSEDSTTLRLLPSENMHLLNTNIKFDRHVCDDNAVYVRQQIDAGKMKRSRLFPLSYMSEMPVFKQMPQ